MRSVRPPASGIRAQYLRPIVWRCFYAAGTKLSLEAAMTENNNSPDRPYGLPDPDFGPVIAEEEAPAYLGVDKRTFDALKEQYGIARRYLAEPRPHWYFARKDLDEVKAAAEPGKTPPQGQRQEGA
jgi:hypothetical protein